MTLEFRKPLPPLHLATTALIVIGGDMNIDSATNIRDKIQMLKQCRGADLVIVAVALPSTVDVFAVSAQDALERIQIEVPTSPTRYFRRFGEQPEP